MLLNCSFQNSSYGSVYKAIDKRDGEVVAIKVLEVESEETAELQREINILKECDCTYIVKYKGSFRKDGNVWVRHYPQYNYLDTSLTNTEMLSSSCSLVL